MAAPAQAARHYRFSVFTADPQSGELHKQGVRLKLQDRPFQLLVALLEKPGEVVTREELRQRLWPEGTFVDFDHSISSAINKLRSVLNDPASHPRYIETVGRRGYRFLADVEAISANQAVAEQSTDRQPFHVSKRRRLEFRSRAIALGLILVAASVLAGTFLWRQSRSGPVALTGRVMLAVLPFQNLTGDATQEYLSDGLTEEMISQLGRLNPERLGVIARTSAMVYKNSPQPVDKIGRELGVQYVIEGSVRRDAKNVRITAQLIQVKDQTHLWAREYDREFKDLLALEAEIAQEIADEVQVSLSDQRGVNAANRRRPASAYTSSEAYDLYLKGRYFWNKRTNSDFQQAAEYFQQAIDKDPNYAPTYAGLADTFALMTTWGIVPQNEFMPKARAAALKALELDESLAEAHTSLALIVESYEYDWPTAEKEFRRAIQLNPEYPTAHHWYAEYLAWQGRFDEALSEIERARQLDPMSLIIGRDLAFILYYSRQYDRAAAQCRSQLDMNRKGVFGQALLGSYVYVQQGKFAEALELTKGVSEDNPWFWATRAYIYGRSGQTEQAQRAVARFEHLAPKLGSYNTTARLLAYSGSSLQKDKLLALLKKAYSEHSSVLTNLKVDPMYDPLRSDPRFQELLHQMRLDQ